MLYIWDTEGLVDDDVLKPSQFFCEGFLAGRDLLPTDRGSHDLGPPTGPSIKLKMTITESGRKLQSRGSGQ